MSSLATIFLIRAIWFCSQCSNVHSALCSSSMSIWKCQKILQARQERLCSLTRSARYDQSLYHHLCLTFKTILSKSQSINLSVIEESQEKHWIIQKLYDHSNKELIQWDNEKLQVKQTISMTWWMRSHHDWENKIWDTENSKRSMT